MQQLAIETENIRKQPLTERDRASDNRLKYGLHVTWRRAYYAKNFGGRRLLLSGVVSVAL